MTRVVDQKQHTSVQIGTSYEKQGLMIRSKTEENTFNPWVEVNDPDIAQCITAISKEAEKYQEELFQLRQRMENELFALAETRRVMSKSPNITGLIPTEEELAHPSKYIMRLCLTRTPDSLPTPGVPYTERAAVPPMPAPRPVKSVAPASPHKHYFKDVRHLDYIDVYRLIELYEITCPVAQHILKKTLAAGKRGAKDQGRDMKDIVDSGNRWIAMREEDKRGL